MHPTDLIGVFAPRFDASAAEWMIVGGVASIAYGEPRFTQDLDVVAAIDPARAAEFAGRFPADVFYCPPVGVIATEAAREAFGHFNLLHLESNARADVYLAGSDGFARRGLAERRTIDVGGVRVPIASPAYVILHKLRFRREGASERHLRDIRAMLRVLGSTIDVAAVRAEADSLGLAGEWEEMERLPD